MTETTNNTIQIVDTEIHRAEGTTISNMKVRINHRGNAFITRLYTP